MSDKWPIDPDEYEKGDYIPPELCEEILGVKRSDKDKYAFGLMGLAKKVKRLFELKGRPIVTRTHHDGVRLLTDAEAVEFLGRDSDSAVSKIRRNLVDLQRVDRTNLDDETRKQHEHDMMLGAWRVFMLRKAASGYRKQLSGGPAPEPKQIEGATE